MKNGRDDTGARKVPEESRPVRVRRADDRAGESFPEPARSAGPRDSPGSPSRSPGVLIGWKQWPSYIWRRGPRDESGRSGPTRSIIHGSYVLAAGALAADLLIWRATGDAAARVLIPGHLLWISAITSLLLLHPRLLQRLDGQPLEQFGWANWLTMSRLAFLPPLVYLLGGRHWIPGVTCYLLLALTDVADGFIARHRGEESKIGFLLDPLTDILFNAAILFALWWGGILSDLTVGLVLVRYGVLLAGCAALFVFKGEVWIQPTPFGKATGLAIGGLTVAAMLALIFGRSGAEVLRWADRLLALVFAACLVHVFMIGWVNLRRPPQGGQALFRPGWGIRLARGEWIIHGKTGLGRRRGTDRDPQG